MRKVNRDSLGDRIKRYEEAYNHKATPRMPLFIRVDGRAFHTLTRNFEKPFDTWMINSMVSAAKLLSKEMSGFKGAYVQSDEATFMITDDDKLDTQGWFNYEINKIVSLSASIFTIGFNNTMSLRSDLIVSDGAFDSRAFNVPIEDAPNVFLWRQRDWQRNSMQMLARSFFSHKELQGKNSEEMRRMLENKLVDYELMPDQLKNGTFITRDGELNFEKHTYETIKEMLNV